MGLHFSVDGGGREPCERLCCATAIAGGVTPAGRKVLRLLFTIWYVGRACSNAAGATVSACAQALLLRTSRTHHNAFRHARFFCTAPHIWQTCTIRATSPRRYAPDAAPLAARACRYLHKTWTRGASLVCAADKSALRRTHLLFFFPSGWSLLLIGLECGQRGAATAARAKTLPGSAFYNVIDDAIVYPAWTAPLSGARPSIMVLGDVDLFMVSFGAPRTPLLREGPLRRGAKQL